MALAASLSLTNCAEKIEGPIAPATPAGIPFEISADISTKTTNDGLATKWATGDAINLFHAEAGTTDYVSDNDFKLDATRDGVFTGTLASELKQSKSYDWYAIYPYNKNVTSPATNKGYVFLGQTSTKGFSTTQERNDSKAHLCGTALPLYGVAKGLASDVKPKIAMKNLASVVAVKVKNTTTEPLVVKSVSFTSTEDIVGGYFVNFTGENVVYTGSGNDFVCSTASLTVNNGEAIAPNSEATFYIPIKPHTVAKDATLKISVNGYEKPLTLPNDVTFTAGSIKTLAFNFNKVVVDYVTLPWAIDGTGGKSIWTSTVGLSQNGLGGDYASSNAPYLTKFDTNGDYVQVKFNSPAKQVSFKVKMIGGKNTSYFTLQGSSNGSAFTDIEKFTVSGNQNSELSFVSSQNIDESYRILRLVFKKGSNVGLGAMSISANSMDPAIYADDITFVSARGESAGELVYTIENQVEGTTLSGSCDGTVVTSVIDHGDGKTFLYEVSKNLDVAREGWIKLTYGDVEKTIKVSQNAPVFTVSRTLVELKADNSVSATITITSDFGWTATTSEGAGFMIDPESYKEGSNADGKTTMTIVALEANTVEGIKNLGNITITNNDLEQTLSVNVTQLSSYQPPFINLSSEAVKVAADATSASFTVESNVEYKVHTDAAWIGLYDETKTSNGTVTILFEANTESIERTALFTVSSTDNTISKTFTLTQSGAGTVEPVEKTEEFTFGAFTVTEGVATINATNFTIELKKGSSSTNDPAWVSNQARLYAGGTLIVYSKKLISKVEFEYTINPNKKGNAPTINSVKGSKNAGIWDSVKKIWQDAGGDNTITMLTSGSAGNVGFTKIKVTYVE